MSEIRNELTSSTILSSREG